MWSLQDFVASISLFLIVNAFTTSVISSENNWLYNTSVQDVLTSGIYQDATEKILEKISNTFKRYASDCPTYKKILIDLSAEGLEFPNKNIKVDLGSDRVILDDIRYSELRSIKRKSFSTSIKCESQRTAKIEVKLPNDLEISANLTIGEITSSESECVIDKFYQGSISLILKDNSISKQVFIQANEDEITRWKILNSKSVVSLNIAPEFQIPIYNKQQAIFDEVELPLKRFLIRKFNAEFIKSGISVADVCSKFTNKDENLEEVHSSQHNLYVMPNIGLSWEGEPFLSTGPILIDGLSSFNNIELTVSESKASSSDGDGYYFFTTPRYDDPEIKEITVKIKTNDLKGRADYNYNSELLSITFVLESIEFEVKKRNVFQYEGKSEKDKYNKSGKQLYYPRGSYVRSNTSNVDVKVRTKFGQMKGKIPNISIIKNNTLKKHVTRIHTTTLDGYMQYSFYELLNKKINESLFVNCP